MESNADDLAPQLNQTKFVKRKNKREWIQRKKKRLVEEEQEILARRAEKSRLIDENLEKIRMEELRTKLVSPMATSV